MQPDGAEGPDKLLYIFILTVGLYQAFKRATQDSLLEGKTWKYCPN